MSPASDPSLGARHGSPAVRHPIVIRSNPLPHPVVPRDLCRPGRPAGPIGRKVPAASGADRLFARDNLDRLVHRPVRQQEARARGARGDARTAGVQALRLRLAGRAHPDVRRRDRRPEAARHRARRLLGRAGRAEPRVAASSSTCSSGTGSRPSSGCCSTWAAIASTGAEQERRVEAAAAKLRPLAEEAGKIGCSLALYNHGGWFGEPENQIAIIERLKTQGVTNVGMVYNLHHGHDHLDRFAELLDEDEALPHGDEPQRHGPRRRPGRAEDPAAGPGRAATWSCCGSSATAATAGRSASSATPMDDAEERLRDNLDGLDWLRARSSTASPPARARSRGRPCRRLRPATGSTAPADAATGRRP